METQNKYENASNRMREIMNDLRLSEDELGMRIGSRKGDIIRNILKMRNGISHNVANRICEFFPQYSYEWVRHGEGEKYRTANEIKSGPECPQCTEKDLLITELRELLNHYKEIISLLKKEVTK